jgi:hypothetical protein
MKMTMFGVGRPTGAAALLLLATGVGTPVGCKKSDAGDGTPPVAVTEDDFKKELAAEHCGRVGLCCQAASQAFSQDTCVHQFLAATFPSAPDGGAAAAPALAFDGTAAAACLAKVKTMPDTCESLFPTSTGGTPAPSQGPINVKDPCQAVYHGSKASGAACSSSLECAPSSDGWAYCNPSLGYLVDGGSGTGVCQPVEAVVGQCGDPQHSPSDTTIKPFAVCATGPCDGGFCHPISQAGGTCKQFSGYVCAEGLTCDGNLCQAPPATGAACPNGQCAIDAYCDSASKSCKARKGSGEPCAGGNECAAPYSCNGGKCALDAGQQCTMGR